MRLPPLRVTVPTLLACCVGCVLFQSQLGLSEEFTRLHEQGLFSRRMPTLLEPESLICPAAEGQAASAVPVTLLSAEGRKVRQRLMRSQTPPDAPSLRQLLADSSQRPAPSITVVLEYTSSHALCRQLEALLHQTVKAKVVWVCAFQSADGGAEARRVVARFQSDSISVVSSSAAPGGDGWPSGTHGLGKMARWQMALQALSRHVLVLDGSVQPGPKLLETLAATAELPRLQGAVLGIAGWRSLPSHLLSPAEAEAAGLASTAPAAAAAPDDDEALGGQRGAEEAAEEAVEEAVGGLSLPLSDAEHGLPLARLMRADVLRGAWFVRTEWVGLLFREVEAECPPGAEEARLAALWRRHGDLRSYVLPVMPETRQSWHDLTGGPPLPPPAQLAAWRAELWRGLRRGDAPPPWRAAPLPAEPGRAPAPAPAATPAPTPAPPSAARKPVALLLLRSAAEAAAAAPLYRALKQEASHYTPRVVLVGGGGAGGGEGGGEGGGGGCAAVRRAVGGGAELCADATAFYDLGGHSEGLRGGGGLPSCDELLHPLDELLRAARPALLLLQRRGEAGGAAGGGAADPIEEAAREVGAAHGAVVLAVAAEEALLVEWVALLPPPALRHWHSPRVTVAIITHRRVASLRRLLASLRAAHFLGDQVDVTFSIEAAADAATLEEARGWEWPHGDKEVRARVRKGGLIGAVVESWYPEDEHSYGLLLEDDIEVSPYFYLYLKLALLLFVYADQPPPEQREGAARFEPPERLMAVSLYTPRLVEVRMPRRRIDLYRELRGRGGRDPAEAAPLFLQQLPCSWGSLFLPGPWREFHRYMRRRLHEGAIAVSIPRSATNGWSTSWKKFLIELSYLRGWYVLYPNFYNQTSFSTNHLEPGEHINGKKNTLKHRPIDFVVPLMQDAATLRELWSGAAGELRAPPALAEQPVLDLFSEPTSLASLVAQGSAAVSTQADLAATMENLRSEAEAARQTPVVDGLRMAVAGWL